ncbi:putative quinol monooxygenase (plasmid) [Novosphingobium resinovorum]|uniref:putative quinol monooxygenase n=1 Tax=Novosphingobium TaxID=165696 RepID=UPI001B3C9CF9|nr:MULTISPECIES: putative quinol monooxygenase [Novosphingobium]MBF7015265.1 antibiotic biosynthesis monooxygenase [Novosphingobium sp. HR1a]WJM29940.1 putative quinol monooxygenase [Novosphingobium resinovorum]
MTILIVATMQLDPAHAERIVHEARPLIEASLEEPGCLAYSWALDPLNPGRIEVFEKWTDEAALAHHFTLPNYTEMRTQLRSAGPIESRSRKYLVAHDEPVYDETGTPRADFFTAPVEA